LNVLIRFTETSFILLPDIQNQISQPELYELFINQIKKDFENSSIDITFINDFIQDYQFIHASLTKKLKHILKSSTFKLNELLYRIDISEGQIKILSQKKPQMSFEELLAELIMKRILQKVVIKLVHKNQSKK
jgi:hypothetical protein